MSIHPRLKPVLYGLSIFVVFIVLTFILRVATHHTQPGFCGMFTYRDLLLGALVAGILTFTHERKKKQMP
ncbi:MAG TPA: hypothetical protein VK152_06610 [Paludibacter sp.]|nr:hypothetical protein [Paludibacter sp.]